MWRIVEPLFPIRDAAPMSAAGFAGIAVEAAILNYVIGTRTHSLSTNMSTPAEVIR
jgi:hypothetical protein